VTDPVGAVRYQSIAQQNRTPGDEH
jgi:hypothetical protein